MKLKKVKVIIQPFEDAMRDFKRAIKREFRYIQKENEIRFFSYQSMSIAFTPARMDLFGAILKHQPKSIYELAKIVRRDFRNVHSDVKALEGLGLVELKNEAAPRAQLKPVAKYSGLQIEFTAA